MTYSNPYASTSSPTNFIAFSGMGMRKGGRAMLMPSNYQGDGSTLSLDFTAMGDVLDPRLTFTRASSATFVNSQGYVQYADSNELKNSTMLTASNWTQAATGGSPSVTINGNNTVTFASVAGIATWLQGISIVQGLPISFSLEVTALTNTDIRASDMFSAGFGFTGQVYKYTNPSGVTSTLGALDVLTGIGLYTVTATTTGTYGNLIFGTGCNGFNKTGSITIARPQVQYGTVVPRTAYVPNASTSLSKYDAPRFDYSPTNIGEPRGLLIEGQAANVANNSNAIGNGGGLTRTYPTGVISPDGTENAQRFTKSDATTPRYIYPTTLFTVAASTAYTVSIWIKYDGYAFTTQIQSDTASDWNGGWTAAFVIAAGGITVGSRTGICSASTVTAYPNGWYRCTATITTGAAPTGANPRFLIDVVGTTGASVLVYGVQLETGSGASSYIPTGASGVTRNADVCDITGTNFSSWFTQPQGTIFVDCEYTAKSPAQGGIQLADNSGLSETNRLSIRRNIAIASRSGTTAQQYTPTATARSKSAFAFGTSDYKFSQNGSTFSPVAGDNGAPPVSIDRLLLYAPGPTLIDGVIRQIKFYPLSLSQTQMNTLTTL